MNNNQHFDSKWSVVPTVEPPSKDLILRWIRLAKVKNDLRKKLPAVIKAYNEKHPDDKIEYEEQ